MMWRYLAATVILVGGGLCPLEVWAGDAHSHEQVMTDAEATFHEVKALVEAEYVDEIDADELWQGATEGMLNRLLQLEHHPTNHLVTPAELNQLQEGIKGEITGIGVMIQEISGALVVTKTLDGGGAAEAGLIADDRILSIDGVPIRGMSLSEVAGKIRGPVDTTVSLLVQRDTKEWTVEVSRSKVVVPYVRSEMVSPKVGLVRLASFTERAPSDLAEEIESLKDQGAQGLILDLRHCPGGLLDSAVDVASLFLPKNADIMTLEWAGQTGQDVRKTKTKGAFAEMPVVVLIDSRSASGAEVVAAALSENDRALLLGERTFGKGTVEKIFSLENGWALKLSVAYFYSPKGNSWQGEGIAPDLALLPSDGPPSNDAETDPAILAAQSVLRVSR